MIQCTTKKPLQGFTLIELAIVLVIIALLAGGVIKGFELLETSRIQKTSEQLSALGSAWYNYLSRFNQLPGDDPAANSRFSNTTNGNGSYQLDTNEEPLSWEHLHKANMIVGEGQTPTLTPWGNRYQFTFQNNHHMVCIQGLTGDRAQILDNQLDDGKPADGSLLVVTNPPTNYNASASYTLCYKL